MEVFLETERLLLRQFTVADADNLVDLDGDPDVMRGLGAAAAAAGLEPGPPDQHASG